MSELNVGQLKGLPVNSNVITVPVGETLYAPGHVIQTKHQFFSLNISTTSTSFVDTGMSISITPKSANSLIRITTQFQSLSYLAGGNNIFGIWAITDSSNNILRDFEMGYYDGSSAERNFNLGLHMTAIVSAGNTSERTYKVRYRTGATRSQIGASGSTSLIYVEEIAV